jgi:hypothetical protein
MPPTEFVAPSPTAFWKQMHMRPDFTKEGIPKYLGGTWTQDKYLAWIHHRIRASNKSTTTTLHRRNILHRQSPLWNQRQRHFIKVQMDRLEHQTRTEHAAPPAAVASSSTSTLSDISLAV